MRMIIFALAIGIDFQSMNVLHRDNNHNISIISDFGDLFTERTNYLLMASSGGSAINMQLLHSMMEEPLAALEKKLLGIGDCRFNQGKGQHGQVVQ